MSIANQTALQLFSVDQILNRTPLTVAPDTLTAVVVEQMCQTVEQAYQISEADSELPQPTTYSNCALIVADNRLLGIFTERDLVRLVAEGVDLDTVEIATVMTQPVFALKPAEIHNIFTVLATLKQCQIRQLPIVDEAGGLVGIVTQTAIRQAMQPFSFLRLRRVGDVITPGGATANPTENLLGLAQRMTQHQASCVVITEATPQGEVRIERPIGIVTERDILQFRALGIPLAQTAAQAVMSTPLFLVHPQDTLWAAHQQMQQRHTRRLVVADEAGGLAGIVTQASLIEILDPTEMLAEIEQLQQLSDEQTARLSQTNQQLLAEIAERQRLEAVLYEANQVLEQQLGSQAAQLLQTDAALKQQVQERQQAQVELSQLFSVVPSLLCIAGFDGYFKKLNPSFSQILGHDETDLLAEPFITFIHPEDRLATQAEMERLATGERSIGFENRYRCKDGSYCWLSWNTTADLAAQTIYAAARDVTAQKQSEHDLRQERDFTTAVLDTVGSLVIVLDQAGSIVRFNRTCEQVSGYAAAELMGQPLWSILIPPEERAAVQAIFQKLCQGQAPNQYENNWVSKDGIRRLISWSNTILKDESGGVEYIIGTGIDITHQRQTEQTLALQYQQRQLLGEITRKIRESLEIDDILQTAVTEVRQLLACDRTIIIECGADATGTVIQESIHPGSSPLSLLNQVVSNLKLTNRTAGLQACACEDLETATCSFYTSRFLNQLNAQSCIEVAIHVGDQLWGLITAIQCNRPRQWDTFEVGLMQQLADQMGIALSQAQLLDNLEAKVEQRTNQLTHTNQQLEREIQDRIQIENDLRENQQKLAGILDNADDAIISIDSQQQIVIYNQGAEQIFGYTADEALRQPLDILLPKAFQQIHQQHVRNFAASADTSRQMAERSRDVFGRRKTGEAFPAEASISRLQTETGPLFTVILKDITERRQAEAALKRSEEQLRLITNALPVLICYVDPEQRHRFNNKTYADWLQRPVDELQGRYIWEIMGDDYYQRSRSHIEAALVGQSVNYEVMMTTPDGQSRDLMVTYIPDVAPDGEVMGLFGMMDDISDHKATERLKDEFVSVVGHELRTPLTSIHGTFKLLSKNLLGTLAPKGQEIVETALRNTERLTRLINDVLDLERIEAGRSILAMQTCDTTELMEQAAQAMRPMADNQRVRLSVEPLNTTIWVDPDHITQVLTNLLSNAIKFSPADKTVCLSAVDRKADTLVSVKDQGRGIPPDKLEIIFERFQQVDVSDSRQRGGTGLGLAICKQIVQQHGGKIWAESTFGEGSTFFVTLPKRS